MSITLGTEQKEINLVQFVPDRDRHAPPPPPILRRKQEVIKGFFFREKVSQMRSCCDLTQLKTKKKNLANHDGNFLNRSESYNNIWFSNFKKSCSQSI